MKILMIVTWYGEKNKDKFTGNFHKDMANALGINNDIAIYFPFDNNIENSLEYSYEDHLLVFRGKTSNSGFLDRVAKVNRDFKAINSVFSPDIVHAHVVTGAGEVAMIINKLFKIPYIVTEHAPIEMLNLNKKAKLKYRLITNFSRANVAVSTNLQERLNKIYKNSHYVYINNGVIDPIDSVENSNIIYAKKDCVNCAIVGGLYSKEIKGLQYLLPAIQKLVQEGVKIHLHICGGGTYLDYFQTLSKNLKLESNVTFYGMCEKSLVYNIIHQMDFTISASLYESAGVAVEEACLLGKPQVITNSGGANSLIPDKFAIKVERGSVDELYWGIKKMICKYAEYDRREIRQYGLQEFLMEKSCEQYMQLYQNVLKSK